MFSAASKVGGSITGKKLPGEEATAIQSPTMAMMGGQTDPNKPDAPICSPGGGGFKMPKKPDKMFQGGGDNTSTSEPIGQQVTSILQFPKPRTTSPCPNGSAFWRLTN